MATGRPTAVQSALSLPATMMTISLAPIGRLKWLHPLYDYFVAHS